MKARLILGVTGGIATGKTTVLELLSKSGIPTISSDTLAHDSIRKGCPAYRAIRRQFGDGILAQDGEIDRKRLGTIVFHDPKRRRQLEKIVHPQVLKGLQKFVAAKRGIVALDIPLLFEAGYDRFVDQVLVVAASRGQQLKRLRRRNGLTREDALLRLKAQWPLVKKRKRADFVIENNGSRVELRLKVDRFLTRFSKLSTLKK